MKRYVLSAVLVSVAALAVAVAQDDSKPKGAKKANEQAEKVGTITGRLKSRWLRREPALIHVKAIAGKKFKPKKPAVMDQENLVFKPHILAVLKGTTVRFPNSDSVRHNVYSPDKASAQGFNLGTYDAGVVKELVFDKEGEVPLLCNVHAEMSAYIVVTGTPFFVWTDKTGAFKLEGVPVGKHSVAVWHERFRSQKVEVEVTAGKSVEAVFGKLKKR